MNPIWFVEILWGYWRFPEDPRCIRSQTVKVVGNSSWILHDAPRLPEILLQLLSIEKGLWCAADVPFIRSQLILGHSFAIVLCRFFQRTVYPIRILQGRSRLFAMPQTKWNKLYTIVTWWHFNRSFQSRLKGDLDPCFGPLYSALLRFTIVDRRLRFYESISPTIDVWIKDIEIPSRLYPLPPPPVQRSTHLHLDGDVKNRTDWSADVNPADIIRLLKFPFALPSSFFFFCFSFFCSCPPLLHHFFHIRRGRKGQNSGCFFLLLLLDFIVITI